MRAEVIDQQFMGARRGDVIDVDQKHARVRQAVAQERLRLLPDEPQVFTSPAAPSPVRERVGFSGAVAVPVERWRPALCAAPDVSVLVRTFNDRPDWLDEAVASALAQDGVSVEVVIVDDGSDLPPAVPHDPRVAVLTLPANMGLAEACNAGVRRCRGRYVRLLDSDDRLPAGALAAQYKALEAHPEAVVCYGRLQPMEPWAGGEWGQDADLAKIWDGKRETLLPAILKAPNNLLVGPSRMWRRDAGLAEVPADYVTAEDGAWTRSALATADPARLIRLDQVVLDYRVRAGSNSGGGEVKTDAAGALRRSLCLERVAASRRLTELERAAVVIDRPVRVAYLDMLLSTGGAQWSLAQVAATIDRRLVEPAFFCDRPSPELSGWLAAQGVPVYRRPGDGQSNADRYREWLPGALREWGADVANTVWQAHLVDEGVRQAVPYTVGHLQSCCLDAAQVAGPQTSEAVIGRFDRFVAVSMDVLKTNPHLADKAIFIPSPVDSVSIRAARPLRAPMRAMLGANDGEIVVVWSGRIYAIEKCAGRLRKVIDLCAERSDRVRWLILGSVSPDAPWARSLRDDWVRYVAARPQVTWVSDLWAWQLPGLLNAADVFLSTSVVEGMSLSQLEAMAARCVPVVTPCGGVAHTVVDGVNGYIPRPSNEEALAGAVLQLANMPEAERRAIGELALHTAAARCDVREVSRQHASMYLAARSKPAAPPQAKRRGGRKVTV